MMLGHLAPFGPIASAIEHRWKPEWPRWTRALPWIAALAGSLFPDLDIIFNILRHGQAWHTHLWPHSLLPYLPLWAVSYGLCRWRRSRIAGLTMLTFCINVYIHLLLDTIAHGTVLFYPLSSHSIGWHYPVLPGRSMLAAYLHSANVLWEIGLIVAAGVWWLKQYVTFRKQAWLNRPRHTGIKHLSSLPRHEGSRALSYKQH